MTIDILVNTPQETQSIAEALATLLRAGDLVMLSGDLGAGKTTFAQGLGKGLGVGGQVSSPTFIIARVHPGNKPRPDMIHVDAYRITSLDDLETLDLDSSLPEAVTVVEWGEGKTERLTSDRLEIQLVRPRGTQYTAPDHLSEPVDLAQIDDGSRTLRITGLGTRWSGPELSQVLQPFRD